MSHKSLLFCPDEKTARTVIQVLSELDFTVDSAPEASVAVRKLADERFDALVVDCQNEADAALLFKTARDSSQNHSCLSVAVVDGQSGVAKAFRIGANLVLTKPINIEQSKSTLRVARGLLRKNEPRVPQAATLESKIAQSAAGTYPPADSLLPAAALSATAITPKLPARTLAATPPSALDVEPEPTQAPEAADVAVLESLPSPWGRSRPPQPAPAPRVEPLSISVRELGAAAAAPAPALDNRSELTASMHPTSTNSPMKEGSLDRSARQVDFSRLENREERKAATLLRIAGLALALGAFGYVGLKLHWLDNVIGRPTPAATPATVTPAPATSEAPAAEPATVLQPDLPPETKAASSKQGSAPVERAQAARDAAPDTIDVQELPMSPDAKASRPAPLVVKTGTGTG
ncbi:MAG: hypothetical protein JO159_12010, partial [Acidobacteria bacterium]|nr:hypothetical protein [Acidobacteriota bacterium]